ncbi:hypothetical protein BKA70DRAFT_1442346 [Coprinopsis sp. MPI-PUGE-AT-0042]|nr:hypothetical protein BKA70DRAFT_1442346 [Coprinopsis sp. MPI-PUGE-AT-0042]
MSNSRVKDKLMKKDETIAPSVKTQPESSRQAGKGRKPMVTVAEGSQRLRAERQVKSPKRSSRNPQQQEGVPVDPLLPATTVKKEESVEPKVEVKKAKKEQGLPALELDLTARFKAAGISQLPLAIPDYTDAIHGVKVPRMFLSMTYGGATQQTFPKISAQNLALHGYD